MVLLNCMVMEMNQITRATEAVVARLRRAGLEGPATALEWASLHGDNQNLFLIAERCVEICASVELLPKKCPRTMSRALSAASDTRLALVIGMTDKEDKSGKTPTGFGMAFGISGRSSRVLVEAVVDAGLVLWCESEWGESCQVRRWGSTTEEKPEGYSPSTPLIAVPSSVRENDAFAGLVDNLLRAGVPWAFPITSMSSSRVPCEMACRMLFHAAGHAVKGNDSQCNVFVTAALREAHA